MIEVYNRIDRNGICKSNKWIVPDHDYKYNVAIIEREDGRHNFVTREGKLMSDKWFGNILDRGGFLLVLSENGRNFLTKDGTFLSDEWFASADAFQEGFARVERKGDHKHNFLKKDGTFLLDEWLTSTPLNFSKGFATVYMNGQAYKLDKEGNIS